MWSKVASLVSLEVSGWFPLLKFKVLYLTVVIRRRKCEILKCLSPIVADTALAALEDLKKAYTAEGANYRLVKFVCEHNNLFFV